METRKVKTTMTKEEYDKIFDKDIPNVIGLKQQEDGSFKCESPHDILPLCIVNEILSQLHSIYNDMALDKAIDTIPEDLKKRIAYLNKKCRIQKRWTLFWYAIALAAILYIIMGGC
jgi:hypothetical protein